MKINSISLISLVSALSFAGTANADMIADFYIGGTVGVGGQTMFENHNNRTDSARAFGAVLGMDIPVFRIEAEYNYLDSKDLNTNIAMLNVYGKMPSTVVLPYIGAGIGAAFEGKEELKNDIKQGINSATAYQIMLGTTIDPEIAPVKFDIEGRALYIPDIYEIEGTGKTPDMLRYDLRVKVRFIF